MFVGVKLNILDKFSLLIFELQPRLSLFKEAGIEQLNSTYSYSDAEIKTKQKNRTLAAKTN